MTVANPNPNPKWVKYLHLIGKTRKKFWLWKQWHQKNFIIFKSVSMALVQICGKTKNVTCEQKTVHAFGETTTTTQL